MTTYRLESTPLIHTPGIVRWGIHHYKTDRRHVTKVFTEGWNLPAPAAKALLSGAVPYTLEDNGETVVFEVEA